jgi:hypothetical protein
MMLMIPMINVNSELVKIIIPVKNRISPKYCRFLVNLYEPEVMNSPPNT